MCWIVVVLVEIARDAALWEVGMDGGKASLYDILGWI